MNQKRETVFFDIEFPPNDTSVYTNIVNDKPFNVAIHWRRPQNFIETEVMGATDLNKLHTKKLS